MTPLPTTCAVETDPELTASMIAMCAPLCSREARQAIEGAGWSTELWDRLAGLGMTGVAVPEELGGSGGERLDAAELVRLTGYLAAPVPLAESCFVAGPALVALGHPMPATPVAVAHGPHRMVGDERVVSGTATGVAWGRAAGHLVAELVVDGAPTLALVSLQEAAITPRVNYAGEPRDTITFDDAEVQAITAYPHGRLLADAALARSLQIAGALERILEMSIGYAGEREQFGRPIARFQAVAHLIARLAEAAAEARMAAENAVVTGLHADVATSKIITGAAGTRGAAIAHQVHGAIGFTREHDLQLFTRRVWSWRDECDAEGPWSRALAAELVGRDPWPMITA